MEKELMIQALQLAVIIGLLPAFIAQKKGKSFLLWWFYGAMFFIAALPHSLWIKPEDQKAEHESLKNCFYCNKLIKREAKVCQYCGKLLHD